MFSRVMRCHSLGRPDILLSRSFSSKTSTCNAQPQPSNFHGSGKFVPKARNKSKARQPNFSRKLRLEFEKHKNETPVISCMRVEMNFYEGMKYGKFEPIPLASKLWWNRKSIGDYFTLYKSHKLSTKDMHFGNIYLKDPSTPNFIVNPKGMETNAEEDQEHHINFEEVGIRRELCDNLKKLGIERAADIQVTSIPVILKRQNTLISAHTGCGKTLAYLLPVVQMALEEIQQETCSVTPVNSPSVLIITPSRELAEQIHDVFQKVCDRLPIVGRLFVGGYLKGKIAYPKLCCTDVLIGSLGALKKSIAAGIFKLDRVSHVVLDEADQLLDVENINSVRNILRKIKVQYSLPTGTKRQDSGAQIVLCSATTPLNLQERFQTILAVDSIERVTSHHLHHVIKSVPQTFLRVGKTNKAKVLLDLLQRDYKKGTPTLIFCNKTVTADWVSLQLNECGIVCKNLTSRVPTGIRRNIMAEFQSGELNVLSTTSMAARGIDTVRVEHVINFEFPLYMSEYVHRVGRVGRIGSSEHCRVTNLVSHMREVKVVNQIEMAIRTGSALENVNANIPGILNHRHEYD